MIIITDNRQKKMRLQLFVSTIKIITHRDYTEVVLFKQQQSLMPQKAKVSAQV